MIKRQHPAVPVPQCPPADRLRPVASPVNMVDVATVASDLSVGLHLTHTRSDPTSEGRQHDSSTASKQRFRGSHTTLMNQPQLTLAKNPESQRPSYGFEWTYFITQNAALGSL